MASRTRSCSRRGRCSTRTPPSWSRTVSPSAARRSRRGRRGEPWPLRTRPPPRSPSGARAARGEAGGRGGPEGARGGPAHAGSGERESLRQEIENSRQQLEALAPRELLTDTQYREHVEKFGKVFKAGTGAQAVRELLNQIDRKSTR